MTATRPPSPTALDLAFLTDLDGVTDLVLVRHGEQDYDRRSATVGDSVDPPLSARGREQARLVGERFREEPVDVIYASPLARALDTGLAIAAHHGMDPIVLSDLREVEIFRDLPRDQPVTDSVSRHALLGARSRMVRDRKWDVYPHSESSAEFSQRVVNVLEGIVASHPGQRVVVACHGGVINTYLGWILGIGADMWFRPAHTAVNFARALDLQRSVAAIGDVHHLSTSDGGLVSY